MAIWTDISKHFTRRERPLKELLNRNMAIEFGRMSPWETPMGQQMAGSIRQATQLGFGNLAQALNKAGISGDIIRSLGEQAIERGNEAAVRGVGGLYQYYNPTQLAVERARLGLHLAELRNQFYRNQLIEDAMNEQSSGGMLGGIGGLVGGIAKLGLSLLPGGQLASLLGIGSQAASTASSLAPELMV